MYTKYAYLANTSQANLMNDIVLLLTGTTNKALLSASCDQANTEILTTYDQAGWTVHDAIAGTNAIVLKAPCVGDAAQFKYVKISTVTAGQIYTGVWEAWNATSHVGTNLAYNSESNGYGQRYSTTAAGTIYVSASAQRIVLWGLSAAGSGAATAASASTGIFECDRDYTWCAVGRGFTPVGFFASSSVYAMPRHVAHDGSVVSSPANTAIMTCMSRHMGASSGHTPAGGMGAPMATGHGLWLSPISATANTALGTSVSGFSVADIYSSISAMANTLDETTFNGKLRIMFPVDSSGLSYKLVVPKG